MNRLKIDAQGRITETYLLQCGSILKSVLLGHQDETPNHSIWEKTLNGIVITNTQFFSYLRKEGLAD